MSKNQFFKKVSLAFCIILLVFVAAVFGLIYHVFNIIAGIFDYIAFGLDFMVKIFCESVVVLSEWYQDDD